MPTEEVKRRNLPPHDIGLTHFRPLWVSASNPATNKEAYDMFHKLYETFKPAHEENNYVAWRFDLDLQQVFTCTLLCFSALVTERDRERQRETERNRERDNCFSESFPS